MYFDEKDILRKVFGYYCVLNVNIKGVVEFVFKCKIMFMNLLDVVDKVVDLGMCVEFIFM